MGSPWELPYQRLPRVFCKDQNSSALLGEKIISTCFNKLLSYPDCVLLHAPECPLASRSHHWLQFSLPKLKSRCFGMPAPTSSTCSWAPLPPITPSWPGNETCLSLFAQNLDFLRSLQKLPVLLGSWGCPRVRAYLHFTSLTPLVCWKPKVPWQSLGDPCWLLWSLKDLCVDL